MCSSSKDSPLSNLGVLNEKSDQHKTMQCSAVCEIEATVCTGFENMAKEEIEEKFDEPVSVDRGRVNVMIPVANAKKILELRSVDNIMVIVSRFHDFNFSENVDEALLQLRSLVPLVNWSVALEVWSQFFRFPHPISAECNEPHAAAAFAAERLSQVALEDNVHEKGVCDASKNASLDSPTVKSCASRSDRCKSKIPHLPSYRATCYRTGKQHSFQSPAAAASFGGEINNYFGWNVDLEDYDIEVVLVIEDNDIRVGISLTRESLHRRDIAQFGPTTLRPTIAYGMLRMCKILPGESVCDPMCGGGSISIEGALSWPCAQHLCGDLDEKAVERAMMNVTSLNAKRQGHQLKSVAVDVVHWDVTALPFKDNSIDVFITDMPFGKRSGSRMRNWHLYPKILSELARACKLETGRVCLLTHDRKCISKTLSTIGSLFRRGPTVGINIGGLAACVYVLYRTSTDLKPQT